MRRGGSNNYSKPDPYPVQTETISGLRGGRNVSKEVPVDYAVIQGTGIGGRQQNTNVSMDQVRDAYAKANPELPSASGLLSGTKAGKASLTGSSMEDLIAKLADEARTGGLNSDYYADQFNAAKGNVPTFGAGGSDPRDNPNNYLKAWNPGSNLEGYNPFLDVSMQRGIHHATPTQAQQVLGDAYQPGNYNRLTQRGLNQNPFNKVAADRGISLQQSQANALRAGDVTNG